MLKFTLIVLFVHIIISSLAYPETKIFELQWSNGTRPEDGDDFEKFNMTSSIGENYSCYVSKEEPQSTAENSSYRGPLAMDFIQHLFNKDICSYRLEPYWSYELCHGKQIRQYRQVFDGTKFKLQQYILGKIDANDRKFMIEKKKKEEAKITNNSTFKLPTRKVGDAELAYVEISMTEGSICEHDRRKRRRTSNVYYMCNRKGTHEIYEVKETASCVYEIVILTPILCAHPKYRAKIAPAHPIRCYANGESHKIPYNLAKIYSERKIIKRKDKKLRYSSENKVDNPLEKPKITDNFLTGKNCFSGGTADWNYEFCFGKHVNRYTYGFFGLRATVCLGKFVEEEHVKWMAERPYKRPKPAARRMYLTQLYADGSVSDVTGRPRQTEVTLKCTRNASDAKSLGMFLYEKAPGEYLLGVESPALCRAISLADDDGVVRL